MIIRNDEGSIILSGARRLAANFSLDVAEAKASFGAFG